MPNKIQEYSQLAERAAMELTGSHQSWLSFLQTASRLYKYPYNEQLMIHAQRPDATACADFDTWNRRMGRYVRKGSHGIGLIDTSGDTPKMKYVFDVSDTVETDRARQLNLWEYKPEHIEAVSVAMEKAFGVDGVWNLPILLDRTAAQEMFVDRGFALTKHFLYLSGQMPCLRYSLNYTFCIKNL